MRTSSIFIGVCVYLVPLVAQADLVLDFSADGSATSFTVPVGGTVEVPIFLRQLSAMSPDITIDPLVAFGFRGNLSGGTSFFSDATVSGPFSDAGSTAVFPTQTAELVGLDLSITPIALGSAIQLGTFEITGGAAGDTVTLILSDLSGFDEFATDSADGFDNDIFATIASTTISAVPEPSASLLGLLAAIGGCIQLRVGRRKKS